MSTEGVRAPGPRPATLDPAEGHVVVINTYVVSPDRAEEALALLIRSTDGTLRHVPGFVSASFHLNGDATTIVNYAQWRSREQLAAARIHPGVAERIEEVARVVESFSPVQYELRASIVAAPGR